METRKPTETELTLVADPDALPRLEQALRGWAGKQKPSRRTLASTYYDTPDQALHRAAMALRVRRHGRRFVQTVKSAAVDGDPFTRGEWEDPIAQDQPDLAAGDSSAQIAAFVAGSELQPLFVTTVRRTVAMIEPRAGTLIEVALDAGEIRSADGTRSEVISEVELELKHGDAAVLYDVALRLNEVTPLRIELSSKSERGYRMVNGDRQPQVVRAAPLRFAPEMSVETVLQCVGRSCLGMLVKNQNPAIAGVPDGVHQLRVAARRLRSFLNTLRWMLPEEHYRWAAGELKSIADALGPARNWEVFQASLLTPLREALPNEPGLAGLAAAAESERLRAYERARTALVERHTTERILRLMRWFETRGWRDQPVSEWSARLVAPISQIAGELLAHRLRQARKRSKHFAQLGEAQRHKLRIALKKLRYAIEFLESILPADALATLLKRVKPLQEDLGHANDVRTAGALLGELNLATSDNERMALARAGGLLLGWHDRALADDEQRLRKRIRRFRRAKAAEAMTACSAAPT